MGGTAYWVEAILWDFLLSEASADGDSPAADPLADVPTELHGLDNQQLHRKVWAIGFGLFLYVK